MFSKACEYGMKSAVFIAGQSLEHRKVNLKEVATAIQSPEAYTSKILQQLSRSRIINSEKGPRGGFSMDAHQLETVNLGTIVSAIDGDSVFTGCGMGLDGCMETKPCPVHSQFKIIREELRKMLEENNVQFLTMGLKDGLTFLKH